MGDFLRFLAASTCGLDLPTLETILKSLDEGFTLHAENAEPNLGELLYQSESLGEIEINQPGEVVFDEDISELLEILEEVEEPETKDVISRLKTAKLMVALQLTEAGHDAYDRIDPLWDALFDRCGGLLQVDDEGFYDQEGILLALD